MKLLRPLRDLISRYRKVSYSQCGEDLILDFIFDQGLHIAHPSYLDLGANDPIVLNNTFLFYQKGSAGVCVEPDPNACRRLRHTRRRDVCLPVGVGPKSQEKAEFYMMTYDALNTFSREQALSIQRTTRHRIKQTIEVPVMTVNEILRAHFPSCPNLVCLDVEGLDLVVLDGFDFAAFRPDAFCVETLTYSAHKQEQRKRHDIVDLLKSHGYFLYADTWINSIFVRSEVWED